MRARIKAFFKWVYDWITVLAGVLAGVPAVLLQFLDQLGGTDLSPLFKPEYAMRIVAAVAIIKAVCAMIESRRSA
jgi:hypothetical protein